MRTLSVPEKHQLKVARDTLRMPPEMQGVMGGPTVPQARRIIHDLCGFWPCDDHPRRRATHTRYTRLMCDECTEAEGGLAFVITDALVAKMPSLFGLA